MPEDVHPQERRWSVADRAPGDKDGTAAAVSWLLRPGHSLVLAALLGPAAAGARDVGTYALTLALFCGPSVLVLGLRRLLAGPGTFRRETVVPVLLGTYVAAIAVGVAAGLPGEVLRAFAVYFAIGVVAVLGSRQNISAHALLAGGLAGLALGWLPPWAGAVALAALAAVAWSRVRLAEHTVAQAAAGAVCGVVLGLLGAVL